VEGFAVLITPAIIAGIHREAGGEVYVSHYYWHPLRHNEGYNVLCQPEGAAWTDEVPLPALENQEVPTAANGFVVLACDVGGYAVIDPNGQLLGMRASIPDVLALIPSTP
jgi:hypothetical protein